jgi:hypothetical protein
MIHHCVECTRVHVSVGLKRSAREFCALLIHISILINFPEASERFAGIKVLPLAYFACCVRIKNIPFSCHRVETCLARSAHLLKSLKNVISAR